MLSRSFIPNFGQGPFPKIAGKSPDASSYFISNGHHHVKTCLYGKRQGCAQAVTEKQTRDKTVWMCRLACTFVFHMKQSQVFTGQGPTNVS